MRDAVLALVKVIDQTHPRLPVEGRLMLRLFEGQGTQPGLVLYCASDADGLRVSSSAPAGDPDAAVDVRWEDLQRLFTGEDNIQDLTETRRARVKGNRALVLAVCQALMDAAPDRPYRGQLEDRLRPYPGVRVHAAFAVRPFVPADPTSLPIVINAFNRVTCLAELVTALRARGYWNLYVIDNASTYPPLIEYYRQARLSVFFLDRNVGCYSLWRTDVEQAFVSSHYAFTDPDVLPVDECPNDFVACFLAVLAAHPYVDKVGFGIKIDDIPDHVPLRNEIIDIERLFWRRPIGDHLYAAAIDTTFAVYRPGARGGHWLSAIRTGAPYLARHATYYAAPTNLPDEELYYRRTSRKATHWTSRLAAYPFGLEV
jgi:hypothetical protein